MLAHLVSCFNPTFNEFYYTWLCLPCMSSGGSEWHMSQSVTHMDSLGSPKIKTISEFHFDFPFCALFCLCYMWKGHQFECRGLYVTMANNGKPKQECRHVTTTSTVYFLLASLFSIFREPPEITLYTRFYNGNIIPKAFLNFKLGYNNNKINT